MLSLLLTSLANDPANSWLSYAAWTSPSGKPISFVNASWVVPNDPAQSYGSNAPGWWYGIQTSNGDGALIQPILAYGYQGSFYSIFNACFDWTDGSWHTSPETYTVKPGDTITSSITFDGASTYTMTISSRDTGKVITTPYTLEKRQSEPETTVYFVLEHQPRSCKAYPAGGEMSFEHIHVGVDGQIVPNVQWEARQQEPACSSKAVVVDAQTLKFTWNPAASAAAANQSLAAAPPKWGAGATAQ